VQEAMQKENRYPGEPNEFLGTAMLIGVLITLAIMALWGAPLLSFSSNELLADLPWTAVWLTVTLAARGWIRRSPKTRNFLVSCSEGCYGRFLSEKAERGMDRFFYWMFRAMVLLVFAAIFFCIVSVAFYH
jgi:hypothetical protein